MAAVGETVDTQAFVTLATNDTYALGALVWAYSLRQVGTTRKLAIMITQGVTQGMRSQMSEVFDHITEVNILDSRDSANLALLTRPDLGVTFTKLHCWRLTQYTKCVFMDADTLVLQNIDELFDREELSAAPDAGWPDCFNSGVFVYVPSEETYQALLQFAVTCGSFDGGDQGLLNMFFKDWATKDIQKHLPFIYNVVSQAFYSYLPAFRQFGKNVKVAHFIGAVKPWHHSFNTATGQVEPQAETLHHGGYLQFWWNLFMDKVQPKLDPSVKRLVQLYQTLPAPPAHATYCQPKEEINYNQMESPYEPPHVETFYEVQTAPSPSSPPKESSPTIIESQDNRQFDFLETFYCEPPMAPEDFYPTPCGAYEAKTFHETWREFAAPKEEPEEVPKESEPEPEDQQEPVIPSQSQSDHISIDGQDSVNDQTHASQNAPVAPQDSQGGSTDYDENSNDIRQDKVKDQDESSETNISSWDPMKDKAESGPEVEKSERYEMGLVGGLASLKIASGSEYSQQQLDDRQRQYNWEHGQIDYLGIDAFAHIQRKLDQTITKPKGPEKPAAAAAAEEAKQTKAGKS